MPRRQAPDAQPGGEAPPQASGRGMPLLTTKLHVPPARPEWVPRPHLLARLDAAMSAGAQLALISAPPGFGKTALLAEWLAERMKDEGRRLKDSAAASSSFILLPTAFAWLSLDTSDNDPARFLAYVIAALQTAEPELGQSVLVALQSPQPPAISDLVATLINELDAISEAIVLVLDDYHLIVSQPIHDAVAFLLDHLPARLHLAIASRSDPPLPLARLRAHGQLIELRQSDLRFSTAEAAAFLRRSTALDLTADDVAALTARTEGWVAGLQMALLALNAHVSEQGPRELARLVATLTGGQHYILDYLMEEVFQRQPEQVCSFLLRTSILDRLCGALCDTVLGAPPGASQAMLEHLDHANLFVLPLDGQQLWYRYHRLFADLLRKRLEQTQADLVPVLHRRASEWFERSGDTGAAIEHALAAGDPERAARLVERVAQATLMRSEIATLVGWVGQLPEAAVRARPNLDILYAWALAVGGAPADVVEARLQSLDARSADIGGKATLVRAYLAAFQGRFAETAELTRQALGQLPDDDHFMRISAAWLLGNTVVAAGDFPAARRVFAELARTSQRAGHMLIAVGALCHLAEVHLRLAELHQARPAYDQALAIATGAGGQRLPIAGEALIGLGDVCRELNELDAALHYTLEGIELSRLWRSANAVSGYCTLARIRQSQGNVAGADEAITLARRLVPQYDVADLGTIGVAYYQALLAIGRGDLDAVIRWAGERALDRGIDPAELDRQDDYIGYHVRKYEYLVLARLRLAQDRPDQALAVLEPVLVRVERQGRARLLIEALMLKALALQARGMPQALAVAERALRLAQPGGYVRLFVDEGEPMRALLAHSAWQAADAWLRGYVQRLLLAFPREAGASAAIRTPEAAIPLLAEPLSERELEVLRLLSAGLSNPEIARELDVAVSTIRTHAKNIYGKLDAHGRWEAVQRARELGLV